MSNHRDFLKALITTAKKFLGAGFDKKGALVSRFRPISLYIVVILPMLLGNWAAGAEDKPSPVPATCRDITVELDNTNTATISPFDVFTGDPSSILSMYLDRSVFTCQDVGDNVVTLTVDDIYGSTTCTATVTVEDLIPPVITCRDITVKLDADGKIILYNYMLEASASDNCGLGGGIVIPNVLTCADAGKTVDVEVFRSDSGTLNQSSCLAKVTVMAVPLIASCRDITVELPANDDKISITEEQIDNGSTLLCSSKSLDNPFFYCNDLGSNTVTLTVRDLAGNSRTCTSIVTIRDATPPTIGRCPDPFDLVLDGSCEAMVPDYTPIVLFDDNCIDQDIVTQVPAPGTLLGAGMYTMQFTISDAAGNSDQCSYNFRVVDNTPPRCFGELIVVNTDPGQCSATVIYNPAAVSDNCSGAQIISTSGLSSGSSFPLGLNDIVFTVTDAAGNTNQCLTGILVQDLEPPVAVCKDISIQLDATGNASITPGQIDGGSTDNCGIASRSLSKTSFTSNDIGTDLVIMLVIDDNRNPAKCLARVTVFDQCKVLVTGLNSTPESCPGAGDATATITAISNRGATLTYFLVGPVVRSNQTGIFTNLPPGIYQGTVSDDGFGGCQNEGSIVIGVAAGKDEVPPVASCKSGPLKVYLDESGHATLAASELNDGSYDDCGGIVNFTFGDGSTTMMLDCSDVNTTSFDVLQVTDPSGNQSTCFSQVVVLDTVSPVARCKDVTITLNDSGLAQFADDIINDGSTDNCGQVSQNVNNVFLNCANIGSFEFSFHPMDASGNSSSCSAMVTVVDQIAPTAVCRDLTVNLDENGQASIDAADLDGGSVDNCSGPLALTMASGNSVTLDCSYLRHSSYQTLIVADASGNSARCESGITVEDHAAPVALCKDVTIELDTSGIAIYIDNIIDAGSYDNCGLIQRFKVTKLTCANRGSFEATFVVSDFSGNSSACTGTVTVVDKIPPVAICKDITVNLGDDGSAVVKAIDINDGSTDNCGVAQYSLRQEITVVIVGPPGVFTQPVNSTPVGVPDPGKGFIPVPPIIIDPNTGGPITIFPGPDLAVYSCSQQGANQLELLVLDDAGNSASCMSVVTVVDNQAPQAHCKDVTAYLDANGQVSINADQVNNGSTDNCGVTDLILPQSIFDCNQVGTNLIKLNVSDASGSLGSCIAQVTIIDTTPPVVVCRDLTVQLSPKGTGDISINQSQAVVSVSDNCSLERNTLTFELNCTNVGVYTGTVSEYDVNGNIGRCTTHITVEEITPPEMQCRDITVQLGPTGSILISPSTVDDGTFDRCGGIDEMGLDKAYFGCDDLGTHQVELTASDIYGNSASCSAKVTVEDHTDPVARCRNVEVMLDETGRASITTSDIDDESYDNCSLFSRTLSKDHFDLKDQGLNTTALKVTDPSGNFASCNAQVTVRRRPAMISYDGDLQVQYSDKAMLKATLLDGLSGAPLVGKKLQFTIGNQSVQATTNSHGTANAFLKLYQSPGNYSVKVTFAGNGLYISAEQAAGFTITPEDALVVYTGPTHVTTDNNTRKATILLTARIEDFSDHYPGKIANATVNFVDRDGGVINPSPLLVTPINYTLGEVSFEWMVDIGDQDARQFTIGIEVGNFYRYQHTDEDFIINVTSPIHSEYVTGGGYLDLCCSEGTHYGWPGSMLNFGFDVKLIRQDTNPVGKIRALIRHEKTDGVWHLYELRGHQMESLVVLDNLAEFTGQGHLTDVTNPEDTMQLPGRFSFDVQMEDNNNPGMQDKLFLSIIDSSGALWFASNRMDAVPELQKLAGGKVEVYGQAGNHLLIASETGSGARMIDKPLGLSEERMNAFPNPFQSSLTIEINMPEAGAANLQLYNLQGQLVSTLFNGYLSVGRHQWQWAGDDRAGKAVPAGIYLARLVGEQGTISQKIILQR
ncbi:MAG TPA: HYR domain-containing protein [Saprospiraceae bacterium]|nr:HYR domain-containing protein [Saprospiraceae bacterium]MCB9268149.1 HYR domain-containing protein [Lewinellaceae bacterium]HPG08302.1 HYR domain-containing protein [Saprospiraceae bacterium]HRV87554.1 HYR domain-containing protein [Saprospiraceae bacterium]